MRVRVSIQALEGIQQAQQTLYATLEASCVCRLGIPSPYSSQDPGSRFSGASLGLETRKIPHDPLSLLSSQQATMPDGGSVTHL